MGPHHMSAAVRLCAGAGAVRPLLNLAAPQLTARLCASEGATSRAAGGARSLVAAAGGLLPLVRATPETALVTHDCCV